MTDVAEPYRGNDDDVTELESDQGTSLGDEDTPVTPRVPEAGGDQLEHGLGTAGGSTYDATVEEGTEFGLGADNTQDTAPVPESDEPDPLRHGLGQADEGTVE